MEHREMIKKEEDYFRYMERGLLDMSKKVKREKAKVLSNLRKANPYDYQSFLDLRSAPCTHFYNYNMPDNFFVALVDFKLPAFYGADSISVIVPYGVEVESSDCGHCNIFRMSSADAACGWVPSYNNVNQG